MRALALVALALAPRPLPYIEVLTPLQQLMSESEVIAEGVIESADPQKKTCVVKVMKSLKGKCPYTHIRMNLGRGVAWESDAGMQSDAAMKHYVAGARAVLFYKTDPRIQVSWKGELFVSRFFSSLRVKSDVPPEKATWEWEQIEIMFNRTFNGTAEELSTLVTGVLSGKQRAPAPAPRVPQIKKEDVLALPPPGAKVAEAKLPAPFRKNGSP